VNEQVGGPAPLPDALGRDLGLATNAGPLGAGISYRTRTDGAGWWTLSSSLGIAFDEQLALGARAAWQLPGSGHDNQVLWDLGATLRPTHWLGVAGVVQNLGTSRPELGLRRRYGPGIVLRPFGDRLMAGIDALWEETEADPERVLSANLRAEVIEGLLLRASGNEQGEVGLGVELMFGRVGAGGFARSGLTGSGPTVASGYLASTNRERHVFQFAPRAAAFRLDGPYAYQPVGGLFRARPGESYIGLLERLRTAANDPALRAVVLELDRTPFSLAQIEELRATLQLARDEEKTVVVYLHRSASNAAYMLASAGDHVWMHPAAELDIVGLSAEMLYFAGALDLLGVDATFARRSEYKSGPEPLTRTGSSPPAQEQLNALLDDLSGTWLSALAEARGRDVEDMRALVDDAPYTARRAEELSLVDALVYPDELEEHIEDLISPRIAVDDDYRARTDTEGWAARRELAVVYVTGTIVSGRSASPGFFGGGFTAGSETIVQQLDAARKDPAVKAVVLRVDSPGGSSFASEEIWRAVDRVQQRGKPVVVSMGGTAASGGYYVSAGADAIYAEPTTVTGSIGVYAGPVIDASELLDRVGVETELYTRGRNAAMFSFSKPMDDHEFAALDRMVDATYAMFKERVADGRGMSAQEVESVARGRVWSGTDALDVGLVDALGGFHDAVARARAEAGIPAGAPVRLVTYTNRPGPGGEAIERSVKQLAGLLQLPEAAPPPLPRELQRLWMHRAFGDERVLAMLPYELEVE
ncbi:MAG: signal peptide peptidase SppA, partial [Myxococcota bacterium]|nr:signal peptide peptidase SppA [Myxococcota bacterium]